MNTPIRSKRWTALGWIAIFRQSVTGLRRQELQSVLILWPILIGAYVWLARQEERQAVDEFGTVYLEYANQTKPFIPSII